MTKKEKFIEFISRFKRGIIVGAVCALSIAIVSVVAVKNADLGDIENTNSISTSAPTSIVFAMPVENGEIIKDFSNTSLKYNATLKQWESHKAIDIKSTDDANVMAVYNGTVVNVQSSYLTGTVVTIEHDNGLQTVYGSLDENVLVKVGDNVNKGQIIGKVSSSAKNESADGNHLHFEVLKNGVKVDPNLYLSLSEK